MKKIHEILRLDRCEGDVGLEFEVEGKGMQLVNTRKWRTERDGSLRGEYPSECAEFVLKRPIRVDAVEEAMDELRANLPAAEFNFSFRTSTHVHVNVQDLTVDEMLAFLYLVLLFEKPLMSLCGESRQGNRFCLSLSDAEGYLNILEKMFKNCNYTMARLDGNAIRYAAINIHSLKKYGSIEFRGMRGNFDKNVMLPWCETLVNLREVAEGFGNPIEVYNKYVSTPTQKFAEDCLGEHAHIFLADGSYRDIERSFSLTIDLPHQFKHKEEEKEEVKVRFEEIPDIFQEVGMEEGDELTRKAKDLADVRFEKWVASYAEAFGMKPPPGAELPKYLELFKVEYHKLLAEV